MFLHDSNYVAMFTAMLVVVKEKEKKLKVTPIVG